MPDTVDVLLMACGETEWDAGGRLVGSADVPLSLSAREALFASLERAGDLGLGLVLTAPDEASMTTAMLVAERAECKVREVAGLSEPSAGLWEGMSRSALAAKCTHAFSTWLEDPGLVVPPEGEGLAEAEHRVLGALSAAIDRVKAGKRGAVSSVGVVLRPMAMGIVLCWQHGAPSARVWEWAASVRSSDGMTRIRLDRDRLRRAHQDMRASA